jgi:hypothetical protein
VGGLSLLLGAHIQAQNVRALWHLDEGSGTTISDSGGNGNTGCFPSIVNVIGSPCFGTFGGGSDNPAWNGAAVSKFGPSSLGMDADDLVFVPSSASLSPTAAITVEAWVKVEGYTGAISAALVTKRTPGTGATSSYSLTTTASSGTYKPTFIITDSTGGDHVAISDLAITPGDGKWHHVAGIYDGAHVTVWLDGNLSGASNSVAFAGSINSTATPVLIGASNPPAPKYFFPGKIDEVRIWARALVTAVSGLRDLRTSAQVALHGLWHFDTLTGGLTTPDSSGYNNTGTFSSVAADAPLVVSPFAPASFGHALKFDGEDKVTVLDAPELNFFGSFTISLYVATDGSFLPGTTQQILGKAATCGGVPEYQISQVGGVLKFTSGASSLTGSSGLTASTTKHIAVVVNGAAANLYLDGTSIASSTTFAFGANNTAPLQIGNSGGCIASGSPQGLSHATIDEVSIYGAAISGTQVAFLSGTMNGEGDLSRAPLVLPGTIGQELGSGVVGPTDWSFDGTSPGTALGFWVPIDPGVALTSITLREHGFESTPPGTCGDVFGFSPLSFSGERAFITATNKDPACIGEPGSTVHFEGNIFLGGDIGLNIHWP